MPSRQKKAFVNYNLSSIVIYEKSSFIGTILKLVVMLNLFQHLFSLKDPDPDTSGQGDERSYTKY